MAGLLIAMFTVAVLLFVMTGTRSHRSSDDDYQMRHRMADAAQGVSYDCASHRAGLDAMNEVTQKCRRLPGGDIFESERRNRIRETPYDELEPDDRKARDDHLAAHAEASTRDFDRRVQEAGGWFAVRDRILGIDQESTDPHEV